MPTNKIVLPTDFSHCSDAALEYATILARQLDATLLIIHAEEPAAAYGGGEMYYGLLEPDHAELQRMLQEIKPTDPKVAYEHRMLVGQGDPANQIVEFAKQEDANLIVLGTHGRTGLKRLLMGSIAEAIVRRAHCPVLVMKQGDDPRRLKLRTKPDEVPARSGGPAQVGECAEPRKEK
jgi:nucleotide-binding universal stress UspA family protein